MRSLSFDEWRMIVVALLTAVTAYSLAGIVAVWAAVGRAHWFFRIAAVLLLSGSWLLVGDGGLTLVFLTQSALVMLWLASFRKRPAYPIEAAGETGVQAIADAQRPRFSLAQLGLAFVLICGLLAILARVRSVTFAYWYTSVIPGVVFAMLTIPAAWAALRVRHRWLRLGALMFDFPALLIGVWWWLAGSTRGKLGRALCAAMLLLIAWLPAAYYAREFAWHAISFPAPIVDNCYADLLDAARAIKSPPPDIDNLSGSDLRMFVAENHSVLAAAEQALSRPCQALLPDQATDNMLLAEMKDFESLGRLLAAACRIELASGRANAAADHALAAICLGAAITHGGVSAHDSYGGLIEQAGVAELQNAILLLDKDQCRDLAERLMKIESQREPVETLMQREERYIRMAYPWKHRLRALAPDAETGFEPVWRGWYARKGAHVRLLACHLALRKYQLETGASPPSLEELSPHFLAEIPLDPFSERSLLYRKLPEGYLLYSVGYDAVDDGGMPAPIPKTIDLPKGDIRVDPISAGANESGGKRAGNAPTP